MFCFVRLVTFVTLPFLFPPTAFPPSFFFLINLHLFLFCGDINSNYCLLPLERISKKERKGVKARFCGSFVSDALIILREPYLVTRRFT